MSGVTLTGNGLLLINLGSVAAKLVRARAALSIACLESIADCAAASSPAPVPIRVPEPTVSKRERGSRVSLSVSVAFLTEDGS